jgi:glycosyltransferase involved in cell wall biosynthesis
MKILHVISNLDSATGGPPEACLGMARLLAKRGHEARIVTTDRNLPASLRGRGNSPVAIDDVLIEAYPMSPPARWGTSWAMRRRLREIIPKVDVVELHSLYLFHDMIAGNLCRRFDVPYIIRPHGALVSHVYRRHRYRKLVMELLFQNKVLRSAAGLHYATHEEARLARPYALNKRGCVIANGVDLDGLRDLPSRQMLRQLYPEVGDRRVLLYMGRLAVNKGLDITIGAFTQLAREYHDVHLVIAGPDGGLQQAVETMVANARLNDRVTFTGMIAGQNKATVLAGSDIFVFPSLGESFGIVVIEAAACGVPLAISDRVNLWPDFAAASACMVAPPDIQSFVQNLRILLDDPERARTLAERAREIVHERFTWDGLGDAYVQMYRQAIKDGALPLLARDESTDVGS